MPSTLHEALVEMLREAPDLVLALLGAAHVPLPVGATAIQVADTFSALVPDFRADCVVKIQDRTGEIVRVVVTEVQLHRDADKHFALPVYQALARARHRVPCDVVLVAPDRSVAAWLGQPLSLGGGSVFRAIVLGPEELRLEGAAPSPAVAFLRALAGGEAEPALVLDAARAIDALPEARGALYLDLILSALSNATRHAVEALMQSQDYEFKSDYLRGLLAKGREQGRELGREEGLRSAIRLVLDTRGIALDDHSAQTLDACADLAILESWARRAAVAKDASEVFATAGHQG